MAMKALRIVPIAVALLFFAPVPAYPQGWYFDVGLEFVDVGKDLSAVDTGLGLALEFGFEFAPGAALNFGIGSSAHTEYVYDVTYYRFWFGPRITFQAGLVKPYLEAGIMSHQIDYEYTYYDIDGTGLYLGGGLLFPFPMGGAAGMYVNFADWEGKGSTGLVGDEGDVSTTIVGVNFIWGF